MGANADQDFEHGLTKSNVLLLLQSLVQGKKNQRGVDLREKNKQKALKKMNAFAAINTMNSERFHNKIKM